MVVTIDGPAGSGKSTAARKLAARLEIPYLDTGAMYRAVALVALQRGVDFSDAPALERTAANLRLSMDCGPTHTRIRADGHDVSEAIRTMTVSAVISSVAKNAAIRRLLVEQQRTIGRQLRSLVSEGRDQGSVVFPDANVKFVLDASLDRRAERRFQELVSEGEDVTLSEVRANLKSRDEVDSKQWEPLLTDAGAVVIDTSTMTIHEVVDQMVQIVSSRT